MIKKEIPKAVSVDAKLRLEIAMKLWKQESIEFYEFEKMVDEALDSYADSYLDEVLPECKVTRKDCEYVYGWNACLEMIEANRKK